MIRRATPEPADWQAFVLEHGWRANGYELAAVLGTSIDEVQRLRSTGACKQLPAPKSFTELFSLWHGRPPAEEDWPVPRKIGSRRCYEWQLPELTLLVSLVGQMGNDDIARVLTARLRQRTGDATATRSRTAVQVRVNQIGLQSSDVVGGITTTAAAREIGSLPIIQNAIRENKLHPRRSGRLWVIPHAEWAAWKTTRVAPPDGYVLLSSIRDQLAIRSDKLSEYARMGYVPTAIRCNPAGTKGPSTKFGTWYIDETAAAKLVADRHAGRPMPWHGKPMADNLRSTFKLWQARQHPTSCPSCAEIWGKAGAPASYEDYARRYPSLAHGAKRHLTRPWTPGMTISEVAQYTGMGERFVRKAIANGLLAATVDHGRSYVSRTDATRWKTRKCPTGENGKSWISLETACKQYLFSLREIQKLIAEGKLKSQEGTFGARRGITYVLRHQCGQLREKIGFTEDEAARRVGVTVGRLRVLLEGVNWRKAEGIPLATVQAVIKRLESREGYTVDEAAGELGMTVQWVHARVQDGTIKISKAKWDRRRAYISEPMMCRLREAKETPVVRNRLGDEWLRLGEAATEAGVSAATVIHWAEAGELRRQQSTVGWRYHREAVRARARRYWENCRFRRAVPPTWLQAEQRIPAYTKSTSPAVASSPA